MTMIPLVQDAYGLLDSLNWIALVPHALARFGQAAMGDPFEGILMSRGRTGKPAHNRKVSISDEELAELYLSRKMSVVKIANKFGVAISAVYWKLNHIGVKIRSNSESHRGLQVGDKNPFWNGGRYIKDGYVVVKEGDSYDYEHRIEMQKHIRRKLAIEEVVHHINGVKSDNRIANLMLLPNQSAHTKLHARLRGRAKRAALLAVAAKEAK